MSEQLLEQLEAAIDEQAAEMKAGLRALLDSGDPAPLALACSGYALLLERFGAAHAAHALAGERGGRNS